MPGDTDELIGRSIGSYRVEKLLGKGGMGSVYLGIHPVIGSKVAIKFLHPQYNSDAKIVERFYNEARAVNVIGHDNILKILDLSVTDDGLHYFVMEFLDGKALQDLLHEGEPLPLEVAGPILLQICDALEAAHQKGIVHRDLKPDNVYLIALNAKQNFVKLVDFGIARVTPKDGATAGRTVTGMVMGTPSYMSPEQGSGATRQIDGRSDVYSLGVMMFQLATGYLPFRGENFGEVLVAHLQVPAPPLSAICPDVPEAYERVVLRCLAKDQDDRYQSMRELRAAIEECLEELGISTELPDVGADVAMPASERAPARNSKPPAPRRKSDPPAPPPETEAPAVRRNSKPPQRRSDPPALRRSSKPPQRKSDPPAPLEARTKVDASDQDLPAEQPAADGPTQIDAKRRRPLVFAAAAGALAAAAVVGLSFARGGHARAAPPELASVAMPAAVPVQEPARREAHEEAKPEAIAPAAADPAPHAAIEEPPTTRSHTVPAEVRSAHGQTPPADAHDTETAPPEQHERAQTKHRRAPGTAHAALAAPAAAKPGSGERKKDDGLIDLDDAQ